MKYTLIFVPRLELINAVPLARRNELTVIIVRIESKWKTDCEATQNWYSSELSNVRGILEDNVHAKFKLTYSNVRHAYQHVSTVKDHASIERFEWPPSTT